MVACGAFHTIAVTKAGRTFTFGCGGNGRLGHGDMADRLAPRRIEALRGVRIAAVSAGSAHSLALTDAGEVYSFGAGANGRLGHGRDRADQHSPRRIEALREM